jgi:glycosyltransferase involved in cell wall biosynthesis
MKKLRVALECRIPNFQQGIGTAILSLAHALCNLPDNAEHYTFVIFEDHQPLFQDLPAERATVLSVPRPAVSSVRNRLSRVVGLGTGLRLARAAFGPLPASDGTIEGRGFDVVHFPTPVGYATRIPSIYQPWDLQHVHLPQFFSAHDRIWRNRVYKAMCRQARFVSIQTEWGKNDLVQQYGIEPEKIAVIPWGSVLNAYPQPERRDVQTTREKYRLPERFLFFPGITWPHKNHEVAIRALAELKKQGIDISLVCTGDRTDHYSRLEKLAERSGVHDRIMFLGFVSPVELQSIYSLATAMIFPSRFEGFGLPVLEAFQSGLPVLCARATVLPEVAGDAALFFNPDDVGEAVEAIKVLISSPGLRAELVRSGFARASALTVSKAAEQFRVLYHKTASPHVAKESEPLAIASQGRTR